MQSNGKFIINAKIKPRKDAVNLKLRNLTPTKISSFTVWSTVKSEILWWILVTFLNLLIYNDTIFSSPGPKGHVSYCYPLASVVVVVVVVCRRRKLFSKIFFSKTANATDLKL